MFKTILLLICCSFSWLAIYGLIKLIDIAGSSIFKNWKNIIT